MILFGFVLFSIIPVYWLDTDIPLSNTYTDTDIPHQYQYRLYWLY